jgi:hypothetical protein
MFIRVTPYSFDPTKEQEVLRISHERLVPALRQLPGFRSYTGAGDRATGRGVAITEWDDLEHAQTLRTAISGLVQEMADPGLHLETAQLYEVQVHT